MPVGELFINGIDAFTQWGLSMESSALSALMTPPPNKEKIENKSRMDNGKRVVNSNPKIDERDISLAFHIVADTHEQFLSRYSSFCEMLANGILNIKTKYQSGVVYKTHYVSCSQFSEYRLGLAKFTLKLNEPNPSDRKE